MKTPERYLTLILLFLLTTCIQVVQAQTTESVLYAFTGASDGGSPCANLLLDTAGNLYGTAYSGGAYSNGAVFVAGTTGGERVLYNFTGGTDGSSPCSGFVQDSQGNLYSTTNLGGAYGKGTVFKLSPNGVETVLHSFGNGTDGANPEAGLLFDSNSGRLYGITLMGGTSSWGTVFTMTLSGSEKVIHNFSFQDGGFPMGSLIMDSKGYLYGTTYGGGAYSGGTVFRMTTSGSEKVLYNFTGGADGGSPAAGLLLDKDGNLYGTTSFGGNANQWGTAFVLSPTGVETVLHTFVGGTDGIRPAAALVFGPKGYIYGTTVYGGASGLGTIFRLTTNGGEVVLHSFAGGLDGIYPTGSFVWDGHSDYLYGTTSSGGAYGNGTVFVLH